jgi:hypothetical protein
MEKDFSGSYLMKYVPVCLWAVQKQTTYCPSNTTAVLHFGTASYFGRFRHHRAINTNCKIMLKMHENNTRSVQGQCPSWVVKLDAAGGDNELMLVIGIVKLRTTR